MPYVTNLFDIIYNYTKHMFCRYSDCNRAFCTLFNSVSSPPFVDTKSRLPWYWRCHDLTNILIYMRNERWPQYSRRMCSSAFIDSFQRHKWVFILIITRHTRLRKQNIHLWCKCLLHVTDKCSYIIEYQLIQTCALIMFY